MPLYEWMLAAMLIAPRRRPLALLVPLLLVGLLATGCAADPFMGMFGGGGGSSSGGGDSKDGIDPSANPEDEDGETGGGTKAGAGEGGGGQACLVGTWKMDNALFESQLREMMAKEAGGMAVAFAIGGDSLLRFDDAGSYFAWTEDFTMTSSAQGMSVVFTANSGRTGSYGVVDSFVWLSETMEIFSNDVLKAGDHIVVGSGGDYTVHTETFTYSGTVPEFGNTEPLDGVGLFTCAGDVLTIEADEGLSSKFARTAARTPSS